jgi:hypothetical protein
VDHPTGHSRAAHGATVAAPQATARSGDRVRERVAWQARARLSDEYPLPGESEFETWRSDHPRRRRND